MAKSPVMESGKYVQKEFRSDEDVWSVINSIVEETEATNREQGKSFDSAMSVPDQLPFFACTNFLLDREAQSDIARYVYCERFKVPAYEGHYGNQPNRWIQKSCIIGDLVAKRQNKEK